MHTSPSNLKSLLGEETGLRETHSKLPPKPFTPKTGFNRIQKSILVAFGAFTLCIIPLIAIPLQLLGYRQYPYALKILQGTTACSSGTSVVDLHQLLFGTIGSSLIFDIDVGFGKLSFGSAKVVDLVWDCVVSRGGQALLGLVSYKVYTNALLLIMETERVSYSLYSNVALLSSFLNLIIPVVKGISRKLGLRNKLLMIWVAISILWVAFWPTITNAMTGYIPQHYTIAKLSREDAFVNVTDISTPRDLVFQFTEWDSVQVNASSSVIGPVLFNDGPNITLWNELHNRLAKNDINLQSNMASNFELSYNNTASSSTPTYANPFWYYRARNQTYQFAYFNNVNNVQCISSPLYQWGFSSVITFIFAILNGIWVLVTYPVWINLNRKSELLKKGRGLGTYRAVVDMAESTRRDLGTDICAYSDEELKAELARFEGIKYYVEYEEDGGMAHIGLSSQTQRGVVKL